MREAQIYIENQKKTEKMTLSDYIVYIQKKWLSVISSVF